jgi:pimeloyl-ACP methyl ester carboxylesterase
MRDAKRPGLVFIHGGFHTAQCWQPTVAALRREDPDVSVLCANLPGRGDTPGDLAGLTIRQCADSVVAQVVSSGLDQVVLVGHSLAGVTLPLVAAILGRERVARLVFVACLVPAQGESVIDTSPAPVRPLARWMGRKNRPLRRMPWPIARVMFCNGMDQNQRELVKTQLCEDASTLTSEKVDRSSLSTEIPRTWILTQKDRSLPPKRQRRFISNIGGVEEVLEIDAGHDVMVSAPDELAVLLSRYCGPSGDSTAR